jgi:ABC-type uncharacterized transport system permease subunit
MILGPTMTLFFLVILRMLVPLVYLTVSIGFIVNSVKKRPKGLRLLFYPLIFAIGCHALLIALLLLKHGGFPLKTAFEGLAFSALVFMSASTILVFMQKEVNFAAFLFPVGSIIALISLVFLDKGVTLPPALCIQPYAAHTWIVFGAYACFLLSAISSVMYLVQHHEIKGRSLGALYDRLPSLEIMDRVVLRADAIGAALMIIGIVMGFLWLNSPGFKPSNVHAKIALSLLAAVTYACEHILRMGQGWEGKRACIVSIVGFALIMATLLAGHHGF